MGSKIPATILFVKRLKLLCTCPTVHDLFNVLVHSISSQLQYG
jgi:hypothetical protein